MSVQEEFRKKNKPVNVKAVFDIVMGLIYAVVGVTLLLSKYIGLDINFPPQEVVTIFGVLATLYGLFRVYRGYITYKQG
jgi:glucose uptake protein GlcU